MSRKGQLRNNSWLLVLGVCLFWALSGSALLHLTINKEVPYLTLLTVALLVSLPIALFTAVVVRKTLTAQLLPFLQAAERRSVAQARNEQEWDELERSLQEMVQRAVVDIEELKKSNETRKEMLADVSHDLRHPLTSIRGYVELLRSRWQSISRV